jgi:hypothetical protein
MKNSIKLLFTFLYFAHVAFLCAALDYNTQTTATTETFWSINCCEIVNKLTLYAVEDSGDKGCAQPCLELQVIKLFLRHTQSMLSQPTGIDAFAVQTNASTSNILINPESLQRHSATLLVLALLGTASLPDNKQRERVSLQYDKALDIYSVNNSHCSTDKTVYSTIILASITILIFFVACQVVEHENKKYLTDQTGLKQGIQSTHTNVLGTRTQYDSNILRLQMPC